MSQTTKDDDSFELEMELMCNIETTSEDNNMSFYENSPPRSIDENCSIDDGSSFYDEINSRPTLLKRNIEESLDSGYTTEVSRSALDTESFTFSSQDLEEFIDLEGINAGRQVNNLPTDFQNLLDDINFNTPISKISLKRSISEIETTGKKIDVVSQQCKKLKTPEDEEKGMSVDVRSEKKIYQVLELSFDLIGDYTQVYSLPVTAGRHADLKSILPGTLLDLIQGKFKERIPSFKIIDCRYPYEYEGGHVDGAVNFYFKDQLVNELMDKDRLKNKPFGEVLIFHCEFSSERAPTLCRALRNLDRNLNTYPALYYPEMYVLDGGYKNFFSFYPEFCVPKSYLPMRHPSFQKEYCEIKLHLKNSSMDLERKCSVKRLHF